MRENFRENYSCTLPYDHIMSFAPLVMVHGIPIEKCQRPSHLQTCFELLIHLQTTKSNFRGKWQTAEKCNPNRY
jgi:hypothetical protein